MINHLKTRESQNQVIAWASGLHIVAGTPIWSENSGASPNRQATVRNVLGKGEWNAVKAVWYDAIAVPSSDYHFLTGSKPTQTGDNSWFSTDSAHPGFAMLDYKTPVGLDISSAESVPTALTAICETEKFRNWDSGGAEITGDYGYTTNGARALVDWYLQCGGTTDRINWSNWTAWRDFIGANETQDYTTFPSKGCGLTAWFYNGTNFNTMIASRIEPYIDFQMGSGAPAVGVNADNFSIRCEGKIKFQYSETYTFTLTADDGLKFYLNGTLLLNHWANDASVNAGTKTCTFAATAGQVVDIKIEMNEGSGLANLKMEWESTSRTKEVVPPSRLYPKTESKPRYETHVAFAATTDFDTVMKTILLANNSFMQDVDGKMNFYCYEQISPSFFISEDMVLDGTLKQLAKSFKRTDIKTKWEAVFRDINSQYLDFAHSITPCVIDLSGSITDPNPEPLTEAIALPNMSRFQALKILTALADRKLIKRNFYELSADARTYQVIAGDLITIEHSLFGWADDQQFLVIESRDKSPESTADDRAFVVQKWS